MDSTSTADIWTRWPPGMRITLTLRQHLLTEDGATSDSFGPPITCGACRKRNASFKLILAYGPMITNNKTRIFEMWDSLKTVASGNGLTVLSGVGAPSSSLGSNGNFYWDKSANLIYGPKASGAWPATTRNLYAAEGDKIIESDGTEWLLNPSQDQTIFDHLQVLVTTKSL